MTTATITYSHRSAETATADTEALARTIALDHVRTALIQSRGSAAAGDSIVTMDLPEGVYCWPSQDDCDADESGEGAYAVIEWVTQQYVITDGNAIERADTLAEAAAIVDDWYGYILDQEGNTSDELRDAVHSADIDSASIESIERSIRKWEARIAKAMGHKDWYGHGNYHVTAASEAGLNLRITLETR